MGLRLTRINECVEVRITTRAPKGAERTKPTIIKVFEATQQQVADIIGQTDIISRLGLPGRVDVRIITRGRKDATGQPVKVAANAFPVYGSVQKAIGDAIEEALVAAASAPAAPPVSNTLSPAPTQQQHSAPPPSQH